MRLLGALLVVILVALAAVLLLQGKSVQSSRDAVTSVAADLREEGVQGRPFDRVQANRMVRSLGRLIETPDEIPEHGDELRTIAATAAAWADAAAAPSVELTAAVALRAATGELRSYAVTPDAHRLRVAARHLDDARGALAGGPHRNDPTDGVRERLENLQRGQQERQLELDEQLRR